ncbi:Uncharacterized protein APZ42_005736, partial [Daphnia magna]
FYFYCFVFFRCLNKLLCGGEASIWDVICQLLVEQTSTAKDVENRTHIDSWILIIAQYRNCLASGFVDSFWLYEVIQ